MTYACGISDSLPVSAPAFQQRTDFDIKISSHHPIIAKFCGLGKQHIAHRSADACLMDKTPVNQRVAESLRRLMGAKQLSEAALGRKAGVSPRTVANFLHPDRRAPGASGKAPSGKLSELELIAHALDADISELLAPADSQAAEQARRIALAAHLLATGELPPAAPPPGKPHRHAA